MASPDGLRLYFGDRLPPELRELIFEYGFHLWLARPVDCMAEALLERWQCIAYTTRHMVLGPMLSVRAFALVDYVRYARGFFEDETWYPAQLAKPRVWPAPFMWLPTATKTGTEWVAIPDIPPVEVYMYILGEWVPI